MDGRIIKIVRVIKTESAIMFKTEIELLWWTIALKNIKISRYNTLKFYKIIHENFNVSLKKRISCRRANFNFIFSLKRSLDLLFESSVCWILEVTFNLLCWKKCHSVVRKKSLNLLFTSRFQSVVWKQVSICCWEASFNLLFRITFQFLVFKQA